MSEATGPTVSASVEVLRKLKTIEAEADAKLAAVKAESAARIAKARQAAEATVASARADIDRWREVQLVAARSEAAQEAEKIRAEGEKLVAELASANARSLKSASKKLLDAVLGDLRPDGGK